MTNADNAYPRILAISDRITRFLAEKHAAKHPAPEPHCPKCGGRGRYWDVIEEEMYGCPFDDCPRSNDSTPPTTPTTPTTDEELGRIAYETDCAEMVHHFDALPCSPWGELQTFPWGQKIQRRWIITARTIRETLFKDMLPIPRTTAEHLLALAVTYQSLTKRSMPSGERQRTETTIATLTTTLNTLTTKGDHPTND